MGDRTSIRSYIGTGVWLPLAVVLALLAAVFCLVAALYVPAAAVDETAEPALFDARAPGAEDRVYIDVLGISEPLVREGGGAFFVAESAGHEYCLVCLPESRLELLDGQREYWDGHSSFSFPFRLTGSSAPIPASAAKTIRDIFEMSPEAFDANFGTLCFFDAETPPRPEGAVPRLVFLIPGLILAPVFILLLLWLLLRLSTIANALVRLEDEDALSAAADELDSTETELADGDRLRLGERFLFGWRNGLAARWEDVQWCRERIFPAPSFALRRLLVIGTADGKKHRVVFPADAKKELCELIRRFSEKNPKLEQKE